ncbi:MAG TPA: hypothetical protein VI542_39095 [Candidatus Tectomicrobia bacterium]
MHIVMESRTVASVPTGSVEEQIPVRITTTLYELIAAIQEVVDPQDDALVVATVMHILQSRKCSSERRNAADPYMEDV